jgi:hypothetical protein
MRDYLFGLIGLALLGGSPLLGQTPTVIPNEPVAAIDATAAPPTTQQTPPAVAGAPVAGPVGLVGPDGACCVATKTVCCPEHYTKKTTKTCYTCTSECICLCHFHGICGHCDCDEGHCGHPYYRKYLVKKIKPCEEDCIKCVPKEVPCEPTCHHSWFSFGHTACPAEACGSELPPATIAPPAPPATTAPAPTPELLAPPKPTK